MAQSLCVESARPPELEEALRLIFQHLPDEERGPRVANALALIDRGELDPRGVTVVRGRNGLLGAMASTLLPGAAGLVWPPGAAPGRTQRKIEDQLVHQAQVWLRGQGARMAQAIIPPVEVPLAEPLLRNGFKHMTTLWYLRHELKELQLEGLGPVALPEIAQPVSFASYSSSLQDVFQKTLERTYRGTLDCPELNGVRALNEVMQGHRGQAHSDLGLWWLMALAGRPAGVLMLTPVPEWKALDISYLGVVPDCRGRGLGRTLTAKAIREARRVDATQVTLAVDCRNLPAWNMYVEMGFEAQEPREVFLAVWHRGVH